MQVTVLIDFKTPEEGEFWLKKGLEKLGHQVNLFGIENHNPKDYSSKFGQLKLWHKYLRLSIKAVRYTSKGEVIVSWNFVVGAITTFLLRILMRKRKVICLNMITHKKGWLNIVVRKFVYNIAFNYKNLWISVNDIQLVGHYSKLFRLPLENIFVLHDVFYSIDEQSDFQEIGDYVFTGGDAFRDWNNFVKCAQEMPEIKFVCVARRKNFPANLVLPENLKIYFDTTVDEFYRILKQSRIVFLPLISLAPCGLIVMIDAALALKPVIITRTPATKNYVQNDISGFLIEIGNIQEMKEAIINLNSSKELRIEFSKNLKNHIIENFSVSKNVEIISSIINQ